MKPLGTSYNLNEVFVVQELYRRIESDQIQDLGLSYYYPQFGTNF